MAAADGSIIIDTRIDQKGINAGVKGMTNALGKVLNVVKTIGKVLAAAFIGGSIINAIRGLVGSFDLMKSSVADKFKPLTDALATLKGAFINLLVTAIVPLIPFIVSAVQWFTNLLFTVTKLVAALFGVKKTMGGITTETKKATKETRGALAAFDQINILQKEQAQEQEVGPAATPAPLVVPQELLDKVEKLKERIMAFLQPAIDLFLKLKKIVVETFEKITTWIRENPEKFKTFLIILGLLVLAFIAVAAIVWLVTAAVGVATVVWGAFAAIVAFILSPIGLIILAIIALIAIIVLMAMNWEVAVSTMLGVWGGMLVQLGKFKDWFITNVIDPLKNKFGDALDWIKEKFKNVFTSIKGFVKGIIDDILGFINSMVESILAGISAVVSGLNSVNPGIMGGAIGTTHIRMPHLATGAVIPPNAQFAAILGDQRSGRNLEAPESLIRQIIREELGSVNANIQIGFSGSLASLVRELKPVIDKENVRIGGNLVKGKATV